MPASPADSQASEGYEMRSTARGAGILRFVGYPARDIQMAMAPQKAVMA